MTTAARITRAELLGRIESARAALRACDLCERRCGVNRAAGEAGPCGPLTESRTFKRHLSYAEEPELCPSYMVYFAGCNFRCRFCVQAPECFDPLMGATARPDELAADAARAVRGGARIINLLGGEPTIHLHTLLEMSLAAMDRGTWPLPLAINTNMYMTPQVIDWLDGVASLYIADFKFGSDACAARIAGVSPYVDILKRNLTLAAAGTPLIVRHLLMPGHVACCFEPVARWIAAELPTAKFSLMTGYVPAWRAEGDAELGRMLRGEELEEAEAIIDELRLWERAA